MSEDLASRAGRRGGALVSHCCAGEAAVVRDPQSAALATAEGIAGAAAACIAAQPLDVDGGNVMS